jgi:sialidase-1
MLCHAITSFAQSNEVPVFQSGTEGYKSFRIPAIIRLKTGTLLAFCEGRVNNAADYGNVDLVMKRSEDGGRSWLPLQVVADNGAYQVGGPAPVVDMSDPLYPHGKIYLFFNTGNAGEKEIKEGKGIKNCIYKTSVDDGHTWSRPVKITGQVHRPNKPDVDSGYCFAEDWRYYANTPGHAMQFEAGPYKGRIFVSANHSAGEPRQDRSEYFAHGYYTDDHGRTFKLGNSLRLPGSNESMATELSGGRLMMNSRNEKGDIRTRIVSISSDGGATWDTTYFDHQLPDPVCQGSILTIGKRQGKNILAFCNAADSQERNHLTLRISYDDGYSWTRNFEIAQKEGPGSNGYAAYSDLVKLNKHDIGVMYEKDNYSSIVFKVVNWK